MIRIQAISFAIALVSVGNALADDITIDPHPFVSTATRAQVREELQQFKEAGVNPWSAAYNPLASFRSSATREQLAAAFLAERDAVAAFSGEDSGSTYLARLQGTPTGRGLEIAGRAEPAQR